MNKKNTSLPKHLANLNYSPNHSTTHPFKKIGLVAYHCTAIISIGLVASSIFSANHSSDRAVEAIKKINPSIAISNVKTRGSLVEISAKNKTVFATADGKWFVYGQLFNGTTGERVVGDQPDRQAAMPAIAEPQIPESDFSKIAGYSIQSGKKGMPKITILSDPDCPFCKQLDGELKKLEIETHTLLFPIEELHAGAVVKAAGIWCSKNRIEALDGAFKGKPVEPVGGNCDATPMLSTISDFAEHNGFTGTPVLIAEDGRVHQGYMNAQQIKQWLKL